MGAIRLKTRPDIFVAGSVTELEQAINTALQEIGLVGETGAIGLSGPAGPTGADGAPGATVRRGPRDDRRNGINGSPGRRARHRSGVQGIQGTPGPPGDEGPTGSEGAAGRRTRETGDSGSGPEGPPGDTGATAFGLSLIDDADAAAGRTTLGLGSVDNTTDAGKPVSTATQTALNLKATLASPTFTGTVAGVTKAMVGLTNADNTSDAGKPVSTATQTAFDLKAPLASPTFTGTVTVPGVTLTDNTNVTISATTGSRIGQATSKIGFFGVTPVVRPTALTQTYATTSATHANVTQLACPAGGTGVAAGGFSTAANRDLMIASLNAARTDIANLKNFVNQVVDQLQALGLLQ